MSRRWSSSSTSTAAPLAVDGGDGAAAAVGDAEAAVVADAEDPVADGELDAVVEAEPVAAEPSFAVDEGAGDGVELGDVGAPVGDHRAAGEVAAGGLPPVGHEPRLRLDPIGGDGQPAVLGGVGEVVAAASVAERGERAPFELVVLAVVVVQLDRAVALDDRGEQAARRRRREAGPGRRPGPPCPRRARPARSTRVRVRVSAIAGLVDDEQAPARQTALLPCLGEEAVEGAARDPGLGGEVRGGDAGGGGADRDVSRRAGRRRRARRARSSCPRRRGRRRRRRAPGSTRRRAASRPARGRASAARSRATCSTVAGETVGDADLRPWSTRRSAARSWRSSSAVENAAGRPTVAGRDRRDLLHRRGSARRARARARPARPGRAPAPRP